MSKLWLVLAITAACTTKSSTQPVIDAGFVPDVTMEVDASLSSAPQGLGTVSGSHAVTCPPGAPAGSSCEQVDVSGCPGIESEMITATLAVLHSSAVARGTIVHLSGGGGTDFSATGTSEYNQVGYLQVFVAWDQAWETTASAGIKTAACRPATVLQWIFTEPTLHDSSRALAFCGEGHSGGSGQLGYALAQYGLGAYLDYVNEISGPPFARIDLGCNGDAPQTAQVCGATVRTDLPSTLDMWENIAMPLMCGSHDVPATELARWKADSISVGGTYSYPKTDVEFFDCTNNATAVTAMSDVFYQQIVAASQGNPERAGYHCYSAADGCQGEGLGMAGAQDAITAMTAGCTPRHQ